jgi:pimeloyl-ACP methyl ester carboxylesterase
VNIDRAQRLLGLFTSADGAEAIAGDLIEERRSHGGFWFWRHVLGTVLAVSRSAVTDAPLQALNLVAAGRALFAIPAFAGVAAVSLFPQLIGTLVSWIVLSLFWWGGGLWTGASLATIAPTRGMAACVVLALAPMLIPRYRVLGVTRRAHGRSSAPSTGYGFGRLAEDVVRVIDAIGVKRPVIAGHSIAGEELHVLGARHSAKLAGLIYLDAAFNRADGSEDYDAVARSRSTDSCHPLLQFPDPAPAADRSTRPSIPGLQIANPDLQ